MKSSFHVVLAVSLPTLMLIATLTTTASAREAVLPAGTLLQCTMNEPNFSSATVAVGDPVLCHLHSVTEFGQQTFPRGSYLVGHLESAKDPGHFRGKGHATRDVVEWMIPPLWPWKIIMLPARGPRPTLKGESMLELRLMDDVQIPQVSATNGPDWHFFGRPQIQNDSYYQGSYQGASSRQRDNGVPQLTVRRPSVTSREQTT